MVKTSTDKNLTPAVILSCHTIGLGTIRSLGVMGVPVVAVYYNKHDMGYVSKYVTESIYAPHPEKNEKEFLDLLIGLASRYNGSLLIPADAPSLYTVSKNKESLEKHFIVACPGWEITRRFLNKSHTYELAESNGIPAPKTRVLTSIDDVEKYHGEFEYPCIPKPCYGHRYSELLKKMVRVDNVDSLLLELQLCIEFEQEVMLQELIPGDDTHGVNYNSYFIDGEALVEFTAE